MDRNENGRLWTEIDMFCLSGWEVLRAVQRASPQIKDQVGERPLYQENQSSLNFLDVHVEETQVTASTFSDAREI
jgi:hypothetical protein